MGECRQHNSGIGGQAVLEGVMMRNKEDYAVAVRRGDGTILLKKDVYKGFFGDSPLKKIPFIRGIFVFIDSMALGLRCTNYSAEVYAEDETAREIGEETRKEAGRAGTGEGAVSQMGTGTGEGAVPQEMAGTGEGAVPQMGIGTGEGAGIQAKAGAREKAEGKEKAGQGTDKESLGERILMGAVMLASFALALGLFMVLPFLLASQVSKYLGSAALLSLFEGAIRIAIFVGYILLISQMKDIRRLFMYHGAEHKCINCIEAGQALTVENAARASRLHKRCGSSFILFVMLVGIVLFFFIRVQNPFARVGLRILLLPVISGISYELIRFAGSSGNPVIAVLSKPGLWLQGLTTREPGEEMLEAAIASVEAVFDWKQYLKEEFGHVGED